MQSGMSFSTEYLNQLLRVASWQAYQQHTLSSSKANAPTMTDAFYT
jgi:hypothetical protein